MGRIHEYFTDSGADEQSSLEDASLIMIFLVLLMMFLVTTFLV